MLICHKSRDRQFNDFELYQSQFVLHLLNNPYTIDVALIPFDVYIYRRPSFLSRYRFFTIINSSMNLHSGTQNNSVPILCIYQAKLPNFLPNASSHTSSFEHLSKHHVT